MIPVNIDVTKLLPYTLGLAIVAGVGISIYLGFQKIEEAGKAKQRIEELEAQIVQRDFALDAWVSVKRQWDADQKAAAELQAQQDAELAAARRAAELNRRKYREALDQLEEADRACAARPVPAAVDGLLGQRH